MLLSRLSSYSQNPAKQDLENFTIEILAHLFNTCRPFRRRFLQVVVPSAAIQNRFKEAQALTQQTIGRGRVDIVLENRHGLRLLIEVKISARETVVEDENGEKLSQIRKYIAAKAGPVVYLTTKNTPGPELRRSDKAGFLGQTYFEDLYANLHGVHLSELGELFVAFLKEQEMTPVHSFNRKEVQVSAPAFEFMDRAVDVLNEVRTKVAPEFQKLFWTKKSFTSARYAYSGIICYAQDVGPNASLELGFKIEPDDDGKLYFMAYAGAGKAGNPRLRKLLKNFDLLSGGYLWSSVPINGNGKDLTRMIAHASKSLKEIRRAVG